MLWKTTALIVTLAIAPNAAAQVVVTPPTVPENLEVPDGSIPYLMAHAEGTQNYVCLPTSSGYTWTFFGPQATLFGDGGQQVTTHFLSPNPAESGTPRATWQDSGDTSTVWAAAIANSVAPGAIPWLLLRVVGSEEGSGLGGTLTATTTYIQRVNTAGGIAPATGCKSAKDTGKKALVPYSTDYVFYR
jgi:Protein of unknown function (DUF3455)